MAVKTNFGTEDFVKILANYDLGELQTFKPVTAGNVQTTYILVTTTGKFVFRYYEGRTFVSVLFEGELVKFLNEQQYPCPLIHSNRYGQLVDFYQLKPFTIFDFIEGEHLDQPNTEQQRQLIEHVAWLQNLTRGYDPLYKDHRWNYSIELCSKLAQQAATRINTPNATAKLAWFEQALDQLELPESLPKGICHCDFHFSNILFKDGEFAALIDFDDANYTYLNYDLATLINPFVPAFEWDTWRNFQPSDPILDFTEPRHIVTKYRQYRELDEAERVYLFDVFKLSVMLDCIWYFERGDVNDFYERRKIDQLNRLGRDNFYKELFEGV